MGEEVRKKKNKKEQGTATLYMKQNGKWIPIATLQDNPIPITYNTNNKITWHKK